MARYSVTYSLIWEDDDFKMLSSDAKTIFWYLQSSKHGNMIGYYYLPIGYMVTDLKKNRRTPKKNWKEAEIESAFKELLHAKTENRRFVYYDFSAEVVYIPSFLKCHILKNENQAKGAVKAFSEVPFSKLGKQFLNSLPKYIKNSYLNSFETVKKQYLNSFETVYPTVSNNSTRTSTRTSTSNQNKEPEPIKDTISESATPSGGKIKKGTESKPDFNFLIQKTLLDQNLLSQDTFDVAADLLQLVDGQQAIESLNDLAQQAEDEKQLREYISELIESLKEEKEEVKK